MDRRRIMRHAMVLLIFTFVVLETYGTFRFFEQLTLGWGVGGSGEAVHPATLAQVCFMIVAFLLMFILFKIRQVLLIAFVAGQLTLYFVSPLFEIFGRVLPFYGVIGINGMYVLFLYFLFSRQKWAPGSIEVEEVHSRLR